MTARRFSQTGFTLIELLVVMAILVVLVLMIFSGARKGMMMASRTKDAGQIREIGAAAILWGAENNYGEPMYFADGTGSWPHEGAPGKNPSIAPRNPAELLYVKNDPASSYIRNHELFFSPLTTREAPPVESYNPSAASGANPWGTYLWLYPSTTAAQMTSRQSTAMAQNTVPRVSEDANKRVLMTNSYPAPDRHGKFFHALFIDGSVRLVARSSEEWTAWFSGNTN